MPDPQTPKLDALDDALKRVAAAANAAWVTPSTNISNIVASTIEEEVTKAPVLSTDPPELMRYVNDPNVTLNNKDGQHFHITITDSAIPKSYMDTETNTIIMSKAFVNERTPDELKAHIVDMALMMLTLNGRKLDERKVLTADHITADADKAAMLHNLQTLEEDRKLINEHVESKLGGAHKYAKELGDLLYNLGSGLPTPVERINELNHHGDGQVRKQEIGR
jgi:hypothetical protein